jgi:hypothetical protein
MQTYPKGNNMDTDLDAMELDDLGIPEMDSLSQCADCGVKPEISPIDDSEQLFHYDHCSMMNPDNFLVAA